MLIIFTEIERPTQISVDADWAGEQQTRRSISGGVLQLGENFDLMLRPDSEASIGENQNTSTETHAKSTALLERFDPQRLDQDQKGASHEECQ